MKALSRVVARIRSSIKNEPALWAILTLAFLLRIVGIGYGLPLTVVADEMPFTLAALLMLQLKTLIPALNPEAFMTVLPYPPYLSYILLIPFAVIAGISYIFFSGNAGLFEAHLLSDLSLFFMTARFMSVLLGVASVHLVYRIAERWFDSRIAAGGAAFLLATSILHESLSVVGRNWMPTSFVLLFVLYALTRDWPMRKRYLWAGIAAGLGMGISSFSLFALVSIGLYYLFFDMKSPRAVFRDAKEFLPGATVFVLLALIPSLLYQSGNVFLGSVTLLEGKSLGALVASPWTALSQTAYSEPILFGFFALGALLLWKTRVKIVAYIALYAGLYAVGFYLAFRFEPRFMLPLVPLYALLGGYAVSQLWKKSAAAASAILIIPLVSACIVSVLALQNDTRLLAREWALDNLSPEDKVLVYSYGMRLPMTKEAVVELRTIDESALRKTDTADEILDRRDIPHALNLFGLEDNTEFLEKLPEYARRNGYTHLIYAPQYGGESAGAFGRLTTGAIVLQEFNGLGSDMSIADSDFSGSLMELFSGKRFGPDIVVYSLH